MPVKPPWVSLIFWWDLTVPSVLRNRIHTAPWLKPPVVIEACSHGQVAHAVAIEITQRGHRYAEEILIIQDAGETPLGVADLLVGLDRAVSIEEQDPHRAAAGPPVVVMPRSRGQVAHAVAVQIAQRGHLAAEDIAIIQDAGEAALGVADLLVRQDPAGLGPGRAVRS